MYEAIVALPLLGAIIAGVITLFGAAQRNPGEDPPPPHDDHAAPPVPEGHPHGAPDPHAPHAAFSNTHAEEHQADEPSAAGSLPAMLVTSTFLVIACVLSWVAFYEVGFEGQEGRIRFFSSTPSG